MKVPHQQYAHNVDEDNPLYATDGFRMFCFKVLPCSKRFSHDWISCPFTHPAEKAKRRDPRAIAYTGIACPDMKRAVQCPRGDACTFAHNVFEYHMHPSRYRTQLCNDGINCTRKICFFAHTMHELRVSSVKMPEARDGSPQDLLFDDGIDPFCLSPQDTHKMHYQLRTSPKSPVDGWDQSSSGSSDASMSRRTSLQRNPDVCVRPAAGRLSLDHFQPGAAAAALRQQQRPTSLLGQPGRHSVDLAGEVHLQQLRLAAIQAQLQLQQAAALQSLAAAAAAQQHGGGVAPSSVEHLAHALAQLQMASSGAMDHQSLLLTQHQPQQPTLAQAMMQKMLMQQQSQQQQLQQQQSFGQSLGRSHSYPMPENVGIWGESCGPVAADPLASPRRQPLGNDPSSRSLSAGAGDGLFGLGEQNPFHQHQYTLP